MAEQTHLCDMSIKQLLVDVGHITGTNDLVPSGTIDKSKILNYLANKPNFANITTGKENQLNYVTKCLNKLQITIPDDDVENSQNITPGDPLASPGEGVVQPITSENHAASPGEGTVQPKPPASAGEVAPENKNLELTVHLSVINDGPSGLTKLIVNDAELKQGTKDALTNGLWLNSGNLNKLPSNNTFHVNGDENLKTMLTNAFNTTESAVASAVYINEEKKASADFNAKKGEASAAYDERKQNEVTGRIRANLDLLKTAIKQIETAKGTFIDTAQDLSKKYNVKKWSENYKKLIEKNAARITEFIAECEAALGDNIITSEEAIKISNRFSLDTTTTDFTSRPPSEYIYKLTSVVLELLTKTLNKLKKYNNEYTVTLINGSGGLATSEQLLQYSPTSGLIKKPLSFEFVSTDVASPKEGFSAENINAKFKSDYGILRGLQKTGKSASNWMQYRTDIDTAKGYRPHLGEGYLQERQKAANKENTSIRKRFLGFGGGNKRTRKHNRAKTAKTGGKRRAKMSRRK